MGLLDKLGLGSASEEFECNDCGNDFSMVTRPEENPTCPQCDSFDVEAA